MVEQDDDRLRNPGTPGHDKTRHFSIAEMDVLAEDAKPPTGRLRNPVV